jgi:hypothetical protein
MYEGLEDTPTLLPDFVEICIRESCMVTHVCTLCNIKHIKHTDVLVRS